MTRRWRSLTAGLAIVVALTAAGCGSQLDPVDVARTGDGVVSTAGPGGSSATTPGVVDPGTDPGTGADPADPNAPVDPADPDAPVDPDAPGGEDPQGPDEDPAAPPIGDPGDQGSCDGFTNGPGITDSTITIGNSSDISGPVPGLFQEAQDATKAFVAYFNAANPDGICGRSLKLNLYDSRTDAGADQQSYAAACQDTFAMVGSMSAFDSGGAATAEQCGLPDIRSTIVTSQRNECSTCFGAQSTNTGQVQNAAPDWIVDTYGEAAKHAGFLYINAGAAAENAPIQAKAFEKRGMHFDVVQSIDTAEFNYVPYVQQLKDNDVEIVFFTGAYQMSVRLRQTMEQQGYEPKLYMRDPTDYNREFVSSGGSAVEGTTVYMNFTPFEEASRNKETQLYLSYLESVRPGAEPGFFGVFAWSAARLFVEQALKLGGKLTRASMVQALRATKNWTANGMHAEQHPGPHETGECFRFLVLDGGRWKPQGGSAYRCQGTTTIS